MGAWGAERGSKRPAVTEQDKDVILVGEGVVFRPQNLDAGPRPVLLGWAADLSVWAVASVLASCPCRGVSWAQGPHSACPVV